MVKHFKIYEVVLVNKGQRRQLWTSYNSIHEISFMGYNGFCFNYLDPRNSVCSFELQWTVEIQLCVYFDLFCLFPVL